MIPTLTKLSDRVKKLVVVVLNGDVKTDVMLAALRIHNSMAVAVCWSDDPLEDVIRRANVRREQGHEVSFLLVYDRQPAVLTDNISIEDGVIVPFKAEEAAPTASTTAVA